MSNLRDLKDNIISQEPPGVDAQTIKEQQKELKVQFISILFPILEFNSFKPGVPFVGHRQTV